MAQPFIPVVFFATSDLCIIGSNPEMADFTNPRGHLYGEAAYVAAEDAAGNRCRLHVLTDASRIAALEPAEAMAAALNARLANGKLPVAFASWLSDRPAYGSDAYVQYGQDDDLALERREAEDEALA